VPADVVCALAFLIVGVGGAALAGACLLTLYWRRLRKAPATTAQTRRAGLTGNFACAGPYRMFYRTSCVTGAHHGRPPVVLVHGLVISSRYMEPLAAALSPYLRVLAPDLPGFGESDKPRQAIGIGELADALGDWLQSLSIERAMLVGNSFGCQVLAEFAVRHPRMTDRLVLQGPTVDPEARNLLVQIWRDLKNGRREPGNVGRLARIDYAKARVATIVATMRFMMKDRIEGKLPTIPAPVLIVNGTRDPVVPLAWVERATALLPNGRLVLVEGATHTMNYAYPDEMAKAILPFLLADRGSLVRKAGS
jgi:pimeloyl-ACP methyl ester carboxylesterase